MERCGSIPASDLGSPAVRRPSRWRRSVLTLFVIGCAGGPATQPEDWGTLELWVQTFGLDQDLDGFVFQLDGSQPGTVISGEKLTVPQLASGSHTIGLDGVAGNCYTEQVLPQTFSIRSGELTQVTLQVSCLRNVPLPFGLAFPMLAVHNETRSPSLLIRGTEGASLVRVPLQAKALRWSPDGSALAFVGPGSDIYTVSANGDHLRPLTSGAEALDLRWSHDGTRLLFTSRREDNSDIYLMEADGSGQMRLTDHAADDFGAELSPDGARIVFVSGRQSGGSEIYTMNADGSGVLRLGVDEDRGGADFDPVWSPDGTKIAFWTSEPSVDLFDSPSTVYWMMADGSGVTAVGLSGARRPLWSPDGSRLLMTTLHSDATLSDPATRDVEVWDLTSGKRTVLSLGWMPAWSPDGSTVAFSRTSIATDLGTLSIVAAGVGPVTDLADPNSMTLLDMPAWQPTPP